jgi:hypothetical protein
VAASSLGLGWVLARPRLPRASADLRLSPLTPWSGLGAGRRVSRFRLDAADPTLAITGLAVRVEAYGLDALPRPGLHASVRLGFGDDLPLQAVRDVAGAELLVELDLSGDPLDLRGLHAATLDLTWQTYGRHGWQQGGTTLVVPLGRPAEPSHPMSIAEGSVLPLPTRLVVPGDDLAAIVAGAIVGRMRPGDCLAISESALAISENRLVWPRWAKAPSRVAHALSRCFPTASSLATPHGMQAAIDEIGLPHLLMALVVGGFTKACGIRGMFYRLAGWRVALIDDVGGSLPPFDRAIVLAPRSAGAFVMEIARRCGTEAAVVDANALGVRVLAATPGVDPDRLRQALAANPHGNGIERTPIVRIRWAQSVPGLPPLAREGAPC